MCEKVCQGQGARVSKLRQSEKELRDLERLYSQQLGEMARLCDIVAGAVFGFQNTDLFEGEVLNAAAEIMEYVEAVRPPEGAPAPKWVMHILGPDDVKPV